jgi:ferredoxin
MTYSTTLIVATLALLSSSGVRSFVPVHPSSPTTSTSTSLNIFGGLKDAFSNDDSLGKAKNAGLSGGPKYNENVTVNGKAVPNVVVDQKISQVCNAARVKVPYNCQNGECGTCTVKMNGRKIRACVSKVPSGKCSIETL